MSKFEHYQVQHLFLLIGENPLPNYIVARMLLKSGGIVYLIYTSHTQLQAEVLLDRLEELEYNVQLKSIDSYEADSYYIQKYVLEELKQLPQDSIGLNYTGGTKAMAVHAYRALIQARPNAVFSYLDSRRLELCIDQKNGERFHEKVSVRLRIEEIFSLHHLSLNSPALTSPRLPEAAIALAQLHTDPAIAKVWRAWCDEVKRPGFAKADHLSIKTLPSEIKVFLQEYLAAASDTLSIQAAQSVGFQKQKHVRKWLDGGWLEEYTLQQVQMLTTTYNIVDSAADFNIRDPQSDKFQFDVAFTRGYQLFALSCTTDDTRELCKSKLFEAYLRAKQLGGDEARVALVCCFDQPDYLKSQLEIMLDNPQIAVFGRQHLMNLADHIAAWIIKNDREATSNA